tara:strand:+ start:197 stop:334 length:138 start_codon:yes stop_codon:yes gene_type:complete
MILPFKFWLDATILNSKRDINSSGFSLMLDEFFKLDRFTNLMDYY